MVGPPSSRRKCRAELVFIPKLRETLASHCFNQMFDVHLTGNYAHTSRCSDMEPSFLSCGNHCGGGGSSSSPSWRRSRNGREDGRFFQLTDA